MNKGSTAWRTIKVVKMNNGVRSLDRAARPSQAAILREKPD